MSDTAKFVTEDTKNTTEKKTVAERPVFTMDLTLSVRLNQKMCEQLTDFFHRCVGSGMRLPTETFAFYKRLGNFVGEPEFPENKSDFVD